MRVVAVVDGLRALEIAPERYALGFAGSAGRAMSGTLRAAVCGRTGETTHVAVRRTGIVIVLRDMTSAAPRADVERIRRDLAYELGDPDLCASLAPSGGNIAAANVALLQVEQMLLLRGPDGGGGRTTALDDLGPYRFIVGRPVREIRSFCERELAPLVPPRSTRDAELLDTLEAYLRCDRSPLHVGQKLYLHRNTVHERIRRIRGMLGIRLDDAESRLTLQLALLGWRALSRLDPEALIPRAARRPRATAAPDAEKIARVRSAS